MKLDPTTRDNYRTAFYRATETAKEYRAAYDAAQEAGNYSGETWDEVRRLGDEDRRAAAVLRTMREDISRDRILQLDRADVVRVYSGRPGCACGCRGNYSTNPATITRIVNRMKEEAAEGAPGPMAFGGAVCGDLPGDTYGGDSPDVFAIDSSYTDERGNPTRTWTAYTADDGSDED